MEDFPRGYYLPYGSRCALDLDAPGITVGDSVAITTLTQNGFNHQELCLSDTARGQIGKVTYRHRAETSLAPGVADCVSIVRWIYGMNGIWLPRRMLSQFGTSVMTKPLKEGDLIFINSPRKPSGHVGMMTDKETVVHAIESGFIEIPYAQFVSGEGVKVFAATRIITNISRTLVFNCPPGDEFEVTWSGDLVALIQGS